MSAVQSSSVVGQTEPVVQGAVLLIGTGLLVDSLAKALITQGIEAVRASAEQAAARARVVTPDLVVVADDAVRDHGAAVLSQLQSGQGSAAVPVLLICAPRRDAGSQAARHVGYLSPTSGVKECARRVRALTEQLVGDGLAAESFQQRVDALTVRTQSLATPPTAANHNAAPKPAVAKRVTATAAPIKAPPAARAATSTPQRAAEPLPAAEITSVRPRPLPAATSGSPSLPTTTTITTTTTTARRPALPTRSTPARAEPAPQPSAATLDVDIVVAVSVPAPALTPPRITRPRRRPVDPLASASFQAQPKPAPFAARNPLEPASPWPQTKLPGLLAAAATAPAATARPLPVRAIAAAVGGGMLLVLGWYGFANHAAAPSAPRPQPPISAPVSASPQPTALQAPSAERPADVSAVTRSPSKNPTAPGVRDPKVAPAPALDPTQQLIADANALLSAGRFGLAEGLYLKALLSAPADQSALAGLVRVHLGRHDGVEATRWAQRLVTVQPKNPAHQVLLGDALALRGDPTAAHAAWTRAAASGSDVARQRLQDE